MTQSLNAALSAVKKIGKPEIVGSVFQHAPDGWTYANTDKPSSKDLLRALAPDLAGDPWGYVMEAAFEIAAECYERGTIPNILDYHPGAGGNQLSEDESNRALLEALTDSALESLATYTNRILQALKNAGKDY